MTKEEQLFLLEQYLSKGDKRIIYLMYDYLYKVLPGYVKRHNIYLKDEELDEIVQQSIIKSINKISGFRGEAKVTSWLFEFGRYYTMNMCRDNKRFYNRYKNKRYSFTDFQVDPLTIIIRKEQLLCINWAFYNLSYDYQYILYEVILNDKSITYMSRVYGRSYC